MEMDNTGLFIIGFNSVATLGIALAVGVWKGTIDEWRRAISEKVQKHEIQLDEIHAKYVQDALMGSQLKQQSELIKLLGQRTHDLRNVLNASQLIKDMKMPGFIEPVSGAAGD